MTEDLVYFRRLWYEAKDPLMKAFYAAKLTNYAMFLGTHHDD